MSRVSRALGASGSKGGGGDLFDAIPLGYEAALLALRGTQCRWPIGNPDDSDFHFCTANQTTGKTLYCECHAWDARQIKRGKRPAGVSPDQNANRAASQKGGKPPFMTNPTVRAMPSAAVT